MLESGAQLHEISAWLGHDDLNTTATYLRITQTSLIRVADRIEQRQAELEQQRKRDEQKAKRRSRRRPPASSAPSGATSYTVN
jgi:hypothetical protein